MQYTLDKLVCREVSYVSLIKIYTSLPHWQEKFPLHGSTWREYYAVMKTFEKKF